ncbi:MAG: hypothetical protein P4L69_07230 [Desulfosporosinus sp.]|nr:hypothetical protein [Desulfosporosinus sp.]
MLKVKEPFVFNPDQAALAALQWGGEASQNKDKPWLKSWYFPTDAFEPWPMAPTGLHCWHCSCKFDWSPFPCPRSYDKNIGRYRVIAGGFCGPSCAKAYAKFSTSISNTDNVCAMIDQIAFKYYNYKTPKGNVPLIPVAPRKEVLQKFCGPKGLSIKQFRTLCANGRMLTLLDPGFITHKQVLEAQESVAKVRERNGRQRVFHPENPDDIKTVHDLVRVKRTVFGGRGVRTIADFCSPKTKLKRD